MPIVIVRAAPNGSGYETSIETQYPNSGSHYEKVDEYPDVDDDHDASTTYVQGDNWQRDLYDHESTSPPDHVYGINAIRICAIYKGIHTGGWDLAGALVHPLIRYEGTTYEDTQSATDRNLTDNWKTTYNVSNSRGIWSYKPGTIDKWTQAAIDVIQIGIAVNHTNPASQAKCRATKVWLRVYYEVEGPPVAYTGDAFNIGYSKASLSGSVQMDYASCYVWFKWGYTEDCLNETPKQFIAYDYSDPLKDFNYNLTGLLPNRRYYFKAMAENDYGSSEGYINYFDTLETEVAAQAFIM